MKLFFVALLCIVPALVPCDAYAQESSPLAKQREDENRKFVKELNLTQDQAKSIQAIQKKYAPQKSAIEKKILAQVQKVAADKKASNASTKSKLYALLGQRRTLLKPIQDRQNQEVLKLLTPAQQKTWQAFQQKRAAR